MLTTIGQSGTNRVGGIQFGGRLRDFLIGVLHPFSQRLARRTPAGQCIIGAVGFPKCLTQFILRRLLMLRGFAKF